MLLGHFDKRVNLDILRNIDWSGTLNELADVVKTDIQKRFKEEKTLDLTQVARLKKSTIDSKLRSKIAIVRKNARKPLWATENLWKNQKIDKATKTKQYVKISIGPTRAQIYDWLHEGREDMAARPVFGIAKDMPEKFGKYIGLKIARILRQL